jgi:signal transduction histidine kinase
VTELDVYAVSVLTDLHEDVMQRVFATGLGLQVLVGELSDETLAERLRRCIADLDETLDEIRVTLLDLRAGSARAG